MNSIIRTPLQIIGYGVYLYYLGLSFRNAAKALYFLYHVKISHVSIWNWIQKYKPNKMSSKKKKKIDEYIIDETAIKIGVELIWFWVVKEPKDKEILSFDISKEHNMLLQSVYFSHIIKEYGEHPVSTDGGTWYPQACKFLKQNYLIHSPFEKSIIERTMQYIKDRMENFDDYFPYGKKKCKLKHVKNGLIYLSTNIIKK
jgi:putative transposase